MCSDDYVHNSAPFVQSRVLLGTCPLTHHWWFARDKATYVPERRAALCTQTVHYTICTRLNIYPDGDGKTFSNMHMVFRSSGRLFVFIWMPIMLRLSEVTKGLHVFHCFRSNTARLALLSNKTMQHMELNCTHTVHSHWLCASLDVLVFNMFM